MPDLFVSWPSTHRFEVQAASPRGCSLAGGVGGRHRRKTRSGGGKTLVNRCSAAQHEDAPGSARSRFEIGTNAAFAVLQRRRPVTEALARSWPASCVLKTQGV